MDENKAKRISRILLWSLVVLGAGLVVFLFYFIIPLERRNSTAWLNFGVILWLVVLNLGGLNILIIKSKKHSDTLPALLAFGSIVFIYTIIAIGIILSTFLDMSYKFLVTAHVIALFLLLASSVIAFLTVNTAQSVQKQQAEGLGKIADVKRDFEDLSHKVSRLPEAYKDAKKQFDSIKDDFRYISPSDSPDAAHYDSKITALMENLSKELANADEEGKKAGELGSMLTELHDNVKSRKKVYSS